MNDESSYGANRKFVDDMVLHQSPILTIFKFVFVSPERIGADLLVVSKCGWGNPTSNDGSPFHWKAMNFQTVIDDGIFCNLRI